MLVVVVKMRQPQEVKLGEMPEQLGSPPMSSPSCFYSYGFLDLVLVKEKVSFVS